MIRRILVLSVLALGLTACKTTSAPEPQTVKLTSPAFLSPTWLYAGKYEETDVIDGFLHLPEGYEEGKQYPAIVLSHGSGGYGEQSKWWTRELNRRGLVVLALDSFTGRGVQNTVMNQFLVTMEQTIADAFMALNYLSKHPAVDAKRIGVMGWSKGGIVSLYTTMETLNQQLAEGGNRFAYHIPFYPYCGYYPQDMRTTGAPIQIQVGEKDSYTDPVHCERFVERLRGIGVTNVEYLSFKDVGHGWDDPRVAAMRPQFIRLRVQSPGLCYFEQRDDGAFVEQRNQIVIGMDREQAREARDKLYLENLNAKCDVPDEMYLYRPSSETLSRSRNAVFEFIERNNKRPAS